MNYSFPFEARFLIALQQLNLYFSKENCLSAINFVSVSLLSLSLMVALTPPLKFELSDWARALANLEAFRSSQSPHSTFLWNELSANAGLDQLGCHLLWDPLL